MSSPKDELLAEMEAAVNKARRAGMRFDAIQAEIRTLGDRVRMAQRAHVLDHDRREQAQPHQGGRFRVGFRPMGALVDSVMPGVRS